MILPKLWSLLSFFLKEYLSKMMGNRYLIGYISMFLNMSNAIVVSIPD